MKEKCSICGVCFIPNGTEVWKSNNGDSISLDTYQELYIIIDVSDKEYNICEKCYISELFLNIAGISLAEMHHEFGVEYRNHGNNKESLRSLMKSLDLDKSAQTLCSIAYTYDQIGDHAAEKKYYLKALEIDPLNFIASENLKKICSQ